MADIFSWAATGLTIVAALMTASNLGSRVTGYGFAVFTLGAICWIAVGALTDQPAILWTNIVLLGVDIFGVWRWLGRQARVEEGARSAAQASHDAPVETLFPISLLTSAPVFAGADQVGHCVDGMAGCGTGQLRYVVVSQGGLAGVGETLRKLPWTSARVDDEKLVTDSELDGLQELKRDEWPER